MDKKVLNYRNRKANHAYLRGREVIPVVIDHSQPQEVWAAQLTRWSDELEKEERQIRNTVIDGVRISTVFLGLDHSFNYYDEAESLWFETMIFGGHYHNYQTRCETYDQAEEMHETAVAHVMSDIWPVRTIWRIYHLFRELRQWYGMREFRRKYGRGRRQQTKRNNKTTSGAETGDDGSSPPPRAS